MICDSCKKERLVSHFIKNQKYCYQCEYRKKREKNSEFQYEKIISCRMCGNEIANEKEAKKRPRTVFCSKECALKGHKELSNSHWTRKIRANESLKLPGEMAVSKEWKNK